MRMESAGMIFGSVLLSAASQVLLKSAMTTPEIQKAIQTGGVYEVTLQIATSPLVVAGFGCFGLSLIVWLFVLSYVPLSSAYPFVALGIFITVLASSLLFAEPVSITKGVGIGLIIGGVVLVSLAG